MAQIYSDQQFDMLTFAFKKALAYDSAQRVSGTFNITSALLPDLATPFTVNTAVNHWNGPGALSTATEVFSYFGNGLTVNGYGFPISGTVTALASAIGEGLSYISGISISASAMDDAAQTADRTDDRALLIRMLGGNDLVSLSSFADTIYTQAGDDRVNAGAGDDRIFGQTGKDFLFGEDGNDLLDGGYGFDRLTGGNGDDSLNGGDGDDTLYGNQGKDFIFGNFGADYLSGGYGDDRLNAGYGKDTLIGGSGADTMDGGDDLAADRFVFQALADSTATRADVIRNFDSGEDKIDLRALDANSTATGDQAFRFGGSTAAANSVWLVDTGTGFTLLADVTGDRVADITVLFENLASLAATDFLL